jgi:hypothetical protein
MPEPLFPGGLIIKDEEVEAMLWWGAKLRQVLMCPIAECEACEEADRFWWDWCNSIMGPNRVRLQRKMTEDGVPFPPHPGDDVVDH